MIDGIENGEPAICRAAECGLIVGVLDRACTRFEFPIHTSQLGEERVKIGASAYL
jgi:hypothetical protein